MYEAPETGEKSKGVKEMCLLRSSYFHLTDNYSADVHRDILEGVVSQTLKPILRVELEDNTENNIRSQMYAGVNKQL